jgi:hypothetical protein
MKKMMIALAISGVALMAQTGSAPATSNGTANSTTQAPTTKVRKHRHHKKAATTPATPAANRSSEKTK